MYEMLPRETLRDVAGLRGGARPCGLGRRGYDPAILPPESRGTDGRARVVIAVGADQFSAGVVAGGPDGAGRLGHGPLRVPTRLRGYVTVQGNVWVEGQVGFTPG